MTAPKPAADGKFFHFEQRRRAESARLFARSPKKIADVIGQVVTKKAYGRLLSDELLCGSWSAACGEEIARHTQVGPLRRGVLEIFVDNSTLLQDLTFQKAAILSRLKQLQPGGNVRDLRFRAAASKG